MRMQRAATIGMLVLAAASLSGCCWSRCNDPGRRAPNTPRITTTQEEPQIGPAPARSPGLVEVYRTDYAPSVALSPMTQIGYRYTAFDIANNVTEWWLLQPGIDVPVNLQAPDFSQPGQVLVLRALEDDPSVFDGPSLCAKYGAAYPVLFTVQYPAPLGADPCH